MLQVVVEFKKRKIRKQEEETLLTSLLISSQIHDNYAYIIRTMPGQSQLSQQNRRVQTSLVGALTGSNHVDFAPRRLRRRQWLLRPQTHLRDATRGVVGDQVPQAVARQYQALILCRPICYGYLRFRYYKRLQIVVT